MERKLIKGAMQMNDIIFNSTQIGRKNPANSFEITVRFMQNSTWQGEISWLQKNKSQNFRSALEMIMLMDEALTEGAEDIEPVSWV